MATVKSIKLGATPSNTPAQGVTKQDGLTVEQYCMVLETIAGRTATLQHLIMLATDPSNDAFVRETCGEAAEALATTIGALADEATGSGIFGNADYWHYGSNFADSGKAVQS